MKVAALILGSLIALACGGAAANSGNVNSDAQSVTATPTPVAVTATAKTVTIDSPDGVKVVGSMYEAANGNSPALLLLHQWQSDRHSYDEFARQMQGRGFAVLSIDGRGFGESTKKADGSAVKAGRTDVDVKAMLGDVDAAFNFLAKQPNVDAKRIGIVGASYGSSLAIIYAADHTNVATVALLSPGVNYFGNMSTEPAVKAFGERPLFMTAAEDDKESADSVKKLGVADSKATQKIYEKGGHGTALFKVGLANELETFFTANLKK